MEDLAAIAKINNLDMVKGKRTNKRRRITRLKTKLDDFNGMPLRELRDEDLTNLKHNLHKEIKLHNALQNRYESLFESDDPSEDAIAEELSTLDDVKDTHSQLLRRMETLINRRKHYIGALNIEREFQLFMDTADPSISQFEKDAIKIQRQINITCSKPSPSLRTNNWSWSERSTLSISFRNHSLLLPIGRQPTPAPLTRLP